MKLLKCEQRLLDILGYQAINIPDSSQCFIIDDKNKKVGTIVKEKVNNSPRERYITTINSDDIVYESTKEKDNDYHYRLKVRNKYNNMDILELSLDNDPFLKLDSNDLGYAILSIIDNEEFLLYSQGIEKVKKIGLENKGIPDYSINVVNEKILVELNNNLDFPKKCEYQLAVTPIQLDNSRLETVIMEEVLHESNNIITNQKCIRTKDRELSKETSTIYGQTLENAIVKSSPVINTFLAFKRKINDCYPVLQKDLVEEISEEITTKEFKQLINALNKPTGKTYTMNKVN